jgi:hypothetical protein
VRATGALRDCLGRSGAAYRGKCDCGCAVCARCRRPASARHALPQRNITIRWSRMLIQRRQTRKLRPAGKPAASVVANQGSSEAPRTAGRHLKSIGSSHRESRGRTRPVGDRESSRDRPGVGLPRLRSPSPAPHHWANVHAGVVESSGPGDNPRIKAGSIESK